MSALIATAKRLSNVLDAMVQESALWDFIPATAKNAQERERVLVLPAAAQASFQHRRNDAQRRHAGVVGCAKSRAKILPHATKADAILRTRYAP